MTVKEFEEIASTNLRIFREQWLVKQQLNADYYPEDLDLGDWWEHFESFMEKP